MCVSGGVLGTDTFKGSLYLPLGEPEDVVWYS